VIVKNSRAQKAAAQNTASLLVEALPYIQRFRGKIVVVKYGGNALNGADSAGAALASFAQDVVLMRAVGILPVVVHGGGPQIGALMARLGKEAEFRDGLRVTDQSHVDLGFVGHVSEVDPTMLRRLVAEGIIPVVATIGADEAGQAYNINADTVAGALAEALHAEKLIFLTDVEGLRVVPDDPTTLIHQANLDVVAEILRGGGAVGGMKPKIEACAQAVRGGVDRAHILDGRVPHALLLELFTDSGVGTMVLP
jgi:acetylglutamate kinase